jgi:putative glutamine amidotransferase
MTSQTTIQTTIKLLKSNASLSHSPRVLIPACNRQFGRHPFHMVGQKYVDAVRLAGCLPVVVPVAHENELENWLELADGVLLTGSQSNVHPNHFDEEVLNPALPLDQARDQWTLPLVRMVVDRGLPLLGICRGFQEVNVALGGTLHQALHEQNGLLDHRALSDEHAIDEQYGPAHTVNIAPHGLLADLLSSRQIHVNSLHGQGVNLLAAGLRVEAAAPDGVVEAFSIQIIPSFALCVQWHPEWQAASNPTSVAILRAFGAACQTWRDLHRPPGR